MCLGLHSTPGIHPGLQTTLAGSPQNAKPEQSALWLNVRSNN